jgi:hypothetical protein
MPVCGQDQLGGQRAHPVLAPGVDAQEPQVEPQARVALQVHAAVGRQLPRVVDRDEEHLVHPPSLALAQLDPLAAPEVDDGGLALAGEALDAVAVHRIRSSRPRSSRP